MGFSFRKTMPVGRSARVNISKSGASVSKKVGRTTVNSRGRATVRLGKGTAFRFKLW